MTETTVHTDAPRRVTDASRLLALVSESGAELWRDHDNHPFITFLRDGHREHHQLGNLLSRHYLVGLFYSRYKRGIGSRPFQDALTTLQAQAVHGDPLGRDVHLRCAWVNGSTYIDLCTPGWEMVEVTPNGWRVISGDQDAPVRFRRSNSARALPIPDAGGSVEELRRFLNLDEAGFVFTVAFMLAALNGRGPFPLLAFSGEQGTAKSTMSKVVRALVDPIKAPGRTPPREENQIKIAAVHSYVIAFDNLSSIPEWLSDALCRLSTGGGFCDRQLYTDLEEIVLDVMRPAIVNGIPDVVGRPDLADRTLHVTALPIPPEHRKTEERFWKEFDDAAPRIFGALMTVLSEAKRTLPDVHVSRPPRLADLVRLICAAEPALGWQDGTFLSLYRGSQKQSAASAVDADPLVGSLGPAVSGGFEGSTQDLLHRLEETCAERRRERWFPKSVEALSHRIRRLAPALRALGWDVELDGPRRKMSIFPPQIYAD
jgi:hypothetical protein